MNVSRFAGVRLAAQLGTRPRRTGRTMMAVRNVERGDLRESRRRAASRPRRRAPDRVMHAVTRREVVQRRAARDARSTRVHARRRLVGQEHDARLRAELDDVPRAVVLLVAARAFVLLDDVGFVLVDREAPRNARLLVPAHPQPIEVERRRCLGDQRRVATQRLEVFTRLCVDPRRIRIRVRGKSISDRVTRRKLRGLPAAS